MKGSSTDLRIWHQFSVLAQELHLGRAAARLNMTQPPLTQAIATLEASLGVLLFDRTKRRMAFTPAGPGTRQGQRSVVRDQPGLERRQCQPGIAPLCGVRA